MNIDKRWVLLLVAGASALAGAAVAQSARRRKHRTAHEHDHGLQLKSWENEGGTLAPVPTTAAVAPVAAVA